MRVSRRAIILSLLILGTSLMSGSVIVQSYSVYVSLSGVSQLPQPIYAAGAAYLNGSIYLIGGMSENGKLLNTVYVYKSGVWSAGPPLPFALAYPMVVTFNGTIYVIGGRNSTTISPYVLKLTGNGWTVVSNSMPVPVFAGVAFAYGGKIYVLGGFNGTGQAFYFPPSNKIQVFDPNTGQWSIIGTTPVSFAGPDYYFNGTAVLIAGGYHGYSIHGRDAYLYFPASNTWKRLPDLPASVAYGSMAYVNGLYIIIGGLVISQESQRQGAILVFNGSEWALTSQQEQYPTREAAYVQVNNTLIVLGGLSTYNLPTNKMQFFTFHFPPLIPQILSVRPAPGGFEISWTNVNATGYIIYVYQRSTLVTTYTVGNVTSATVNGLINGVTYTVRLQAFNQYGFSPMSAPVEVTPQATPAQPIVKVTIGNRNATVSWTINGFNGSVQGYYVILVSPKGVIESLNLPSSYTSYTFTGLQPGVQYMVEVIAYNQAGNSTPATQYFYVMAIPQLNFTVYKTPTHFTVTWNSTYPANFTAYLYEGGKLIAERYLGQNSTFTFYGPFGIYNLTVIAKNPAGVSVQSLKVVYYLPPGQPKVNVTITPKGLVFDVQSQYAINYSVYYDNALMNSSNSGRVLVANPILSGTGSYVVVASNPAGSAMTKVNVSVSQVSYTETIKVYQGSSLAASKFQLPTTGISLFLGILIILGILVGYVAATRS
ncbi:MAG: fibronectin type III domain-containing protein [Thermoprotei archaeon]